MRRQFTIDELKAKRIALLNDFIDAKTIYLKNNLHHKIKSVNKDLFTLTKDTRYL
jgi:hypothetical protein